MYQNPKDAYLESQVMTATPVQLVALLYGHAAEQVREARTRLAAGDVAGRSRAISRAIEAVVELESSLRPDGGDLTRSLAGLYEYVRARLFEANLRQSDAALVEALGVLVTLSEGWNAAAPAAIEGPPVAEVPAALLASGEIPSSLRGWNF